MTKSKIGDATQTRMKKEVDAGARPSGKADAALLGTSADPTQGKSLHKPEKRRKSVSAQSAKNRVTVIRDTFSMPGADYKLIESLRTQAARQGHIHTKSEVIRAGLLVLSAMSPVDLVEALDKVKRVKPGRKVR